MTKLNLTTKNAFALSAVLSVIFLCGACDECRLEVGQTWLYKTNAKNPFETPVLYHQRIIDIKGDYVLYVENGKETLSCRKQFFVIGAEKENNYR